MLHLWRQIKKWSKIVMFTYLTRFQLLAWRWRVVCREGWCLHWAHAALAGSCDWDAV